MEWVYLLAAAGIILGLALLLFFTWVTAPTPEVETTGERRVSFLNYYALTEGAPSLDDATCLRTCSSTFDCAAVITRRAENLSCEIMSQAEVEATSLERLTAQPGFVRQNAVPLPARHVYFGKGLYSTQGRYWIDNRRHKTSAAPGGRVDGRYSSSATSSGRVIRQDLFRYQQLPWRPQSVVAPEGAVGVYTPKRLDELFHLSPAEWFTLEGELPVYIHRPGEPLQVPSYWRTPWAVYA